MNPDQASAAVAIRKIRTEEFAIIGQATAAAFVRGGISAPDDDYLNKLRDVKKRADDPLSQVLVATIDDELVGTVTYCPFGSDLTQVCRDGDFEFRMLATFDGFEGRGIATALIDACIEIAREQELLFALACVVTWNAGGHGLYQRLGFQRVPELDWHTSDNTLLQTYTRSVMAVYCPRCGKTFDESNHKACTVALGLEPPRYCSVCRRRMVVQVVPARWRARCIEHGELTNV